MLDIDWIDSLKITKVQDWNIFFSVDGKNFFYMVLMSAENQVRIFMKDLLMKKDITN